jgi:regulator of protease activity HflC (stomatin/prohibitin superfamily)
MVPQQSAYVMERLGRFHRVLSPGLRFAIPLVDRVAYNLSLKEQIVAVDKQHAISADNVMLSINGVLYWRVTDPVRAAYGVDDAVNAISQLAQTSMRSELGKLTLDATLQSREVLNASITDAINGAAEEWGVKAMRYEIKELMPTSAAVRETMDLQSSAERQKRQIILDAKGKAEAILKRAKANADSIERVASALGQPSANMAVSLKLAESYVDSLGNLGRPENTIVMPINLASPSHVIDTSRSIMDKDKKAK